MVCVSKSEGGKRCEYADLLANVRRKARYKHAGSYNIERECQKAVDDWKRKNPEIVEAHMPERNIYQITPGRKPTPKTLPQELTPSRTVITGLNAADRAKVTADLYEEYQRWMERCSDEEEDALGYYSVTGSEQINLRLRRSGLAAWQKQNLRLREMDMESLDARIAAMDSAFKKAPEPNPGTPRKVYRLVEIPPGVRTTTYLKTYHSVGEGFMDKAYMSTTADPEYLMSWAARDPKKKYIIFEILTGSGHSIQRHEFARSGFLQSLEQEILIPRRTKFRVVGKRHSQSFQFTENRQDLDRYSGYLPEETYARIGKYRAGLKRSIPLIQLVEEKLL